MLADYNGSGTIDAADFVLCRKGGSLPNEAESMGNGGGIQAVTLESHDRAASMEVTLPPLATVVFKPRP
jgi:hypothetical protein